MPEIFDGNRASFLCFQTDCELLFTLRPRTYATDYIKVRASINLLTGQIKSWAHLLLQEKSPVLDSWETFMSALDSYISVSKKTSAPRSALSSRGLRVPRVRKPQCGYDTQPAQCVPDYETLYVPSQEASPSQGLDISVDAHTPTLEEEEPMQIRLVSSTHARVLTYLNQIVFGCLEDRIGVIVADEHLVFLPFPGLTKSDYLGELDFLTVDEGEMEISQWLRSSKSQGLLDTIVTYILSLPCLCWSLLVCSYYLHFSHTLDSTVQKTSYYGLWLKVVRMTALNYSPLSVRHSNVAK
ncbi:uncharacterized protein LOC120944428 [Rana temporaria]|uniref:uncharacterized protein LOC120944428 n=1 Tax=Rana temporaria TaxID=8407 RepID=UPI001AAD85D2|nr:uncharacterized protein LOC120944428 [Rana temporaria]